MSAILGPNGEVAAPKLPTFKVGEHTFPYRIVNAKKLNSRDPRTLPILAVLTQVSDEMGLLLMLMQALAKDIYTRQPNGKREFQELVKDLVIMARTTTGAEVDIAAELAKIATTN